MRPLTGFQSLATEPYHSLRNGELHEIHGGGHPKAGLRYHQNNKDTQLYFSFSLECSKAESELSNGLDAGK